MIQVKPNIPQLIEDCDFGWWNSKHRLAKWRCHCCGYRFQVGTTIHWIYANGGGHTWNHGNFWVCHTCFIKYPDMLSYMERRLELAKQYYWWFAPEEL